jgi:riboflavin synthase
MFTGIVEAIGKVVAIRPGPGGIRLVVDVSRLGRQPEIGASLSVNGACLTVAAISSQAAEFDVVAETCARSNLGRLQAQDAVNLESSLTLGDALDGHFVQGHVDGTATVERVETDDRQWTVWLTLDQPHQLARYLVPKGSIALDGVSLTLAEVQAERFSVAVIPTTLRRTTFGRLRGGDKVNVETDILVRAVVRQLVFLDGPTQGLSIQALEQAGFA